MARNYRIALNNSGGELDSFVAENVIHDDDGSELHAALLSKLTDDWTILHDGDSITIREIEQS